MFIRYLILFLILDMHLMAAAQTIPVGSVTDDYYRRSQLLNSIDSISSLTARPVSPVSYSDLFDGDTIRSRKKKNHVGLLAGTNGNFKILPVNLQVQINSHHPHGWNDGAMIPAKGFQTLLSGGIFKEYKHLSLQFNPEIVIAENPDFGGFPKDHYDVIAARYYDFYNYIDLPERFGDRGYAKVYWGQSSIRFNLKSLSFGLSTENLWWGPGIHNSLLMSNTAPGFKHLTLNTSKPLRTKIGAFEGQLIAGRLESSGFSPLDPDRFYFGDTLYIPKPEDWRYISGLTFNWQPKWIRGLFLGFSRSFIVYHDYQGKRIGEYFPIFLPFQKAKYDYPINRRIQLSSVFFRWLWPEENAEVYFEYGMNDKAGSFRDFLLEPEKARAYLFGVRKMVPFRSHPDEKILVGLEITQLQQTSPNKIRNAESWYVDKFIRHGYTNRGEVMGAGIGPGANLQTLDIKWIKDLKTIGFQLERDIHNNDFNYYAYEDSQDWRRPWYDLSVGVNSNWDHKNMIFTGSLKATKSYNYQYFLPKEENPDSYFLKGIDRVNIQLRLGLTYKF